MPDQRSRVAAELEDLSAPGGLHHTRSPWSTYARHGDSLPRALLRRAMITETMDRHSSSRDGRLAIVTAGPPGSGKSTAVDRLLGREDARWLRIDPDEIKDRLLREARLSGEFDELLSRTLPDDRPVMLRELSGLVHVESVAIATDLTEVAMRDGRDVLLEGTLRWEGQVDEYLDVIERHAYSSLDVLSVEVGQEIACRRALDRWWSERCDDKSELGGRFLPEAVIRACYASDQETSECRANAEELVRRVNDAGHASARLLV